MTNKQFNILLCCVNDFYIPDERGCPMDQEFVPCANECPQHCSDLQQDIQCQDNTECQPGCRCPQGKWEGIRHSDT